jgi:hypothetical protein
MGVYNFSHIAIGCYIELWLSLRITLVISIIELNRKLNFNYLHMVMKF